MEKLFNGFMKDCNLFNIKLSNGNLFIDEENIGIPLFDYAKTGKLYGKITYKVEKGFYSIFIHNNSYINIMYTEKAIKEEGDLEL